jgi:hypothetical protein
VFEGLLTLKETLSLVEGFNVGGSWRAANLAEVPLPAGGEEARFGDLL